MILPCYFHSIYTFASFTGYVYYFFEVISNLHIQEYRFGGKIYKFGGKSFKKLNSAEFIKFVFFHVCHRDGGDFGGDHSDHGDGGPRRYRVIMVVITAIIGILTLGSVVVLTSLLVVLFNCETTVPMMMLR